MEHWYEWSEEEPILIDIRKVDDEILALILCQAAGVRGFDNYFSEEEHKAILGLSWRRGFLSIDEDSVNRALSELRVK